MAVDERQGVLRPTRLIVDTLYATGGVIRTEDLDWPNFDPERVATMSQYLAEIGIRMDEKPRESSATDSALGLYRRDFEQAAPQNLLRGLYFPSRLLLGQRPRKGVVRISGGHPGINRHQFPGAQAISTGVAVTEEVFEEIVQNAPCYSNKIANRTERANLDEPETDPVIEELEDLGGESALYAITQKHELLEARDQVLLAERSPLLAVNRSVIRPNQGRRIQNLDSYRLAVSIAVRDMARIACKQLGYGQNQTQKTLNAIASNMTRSRNRADYVAAYTYMAGRHNDAVRDKVVQSIHGLMAEIGVQAQYAIHNIDREYTD